MLAWLSVWSEVQTCIWPSWCHCHSLFLASVKSRLVFAFLVPAHLGSTRKRAIKQMCVCVYKIRDSGLLVFGVCSRYAAVPSADRSHWSRDVLALSTQRESTLRSVASRLRSRGLLRLSVGHHQGNAAAQLLCPRRRDPSAFCAAGNVQCKHVCCYFVCVCVCVPNFI